jgi:hypothetical protein
MTNETNSWKLGHDDPFDLHSMDGRHVHTLGVGRASKKLP